MRELRLDYRCYLLACRMADASPFIGKLIKAMYGTRGAPLVWQEVVKKTMLRMGFTCCTTSPGVFYHEKRELRVVTHVDDFSVGGWKEDLIRLK